MKPTKFNPTTIAANIKHRRKSLRLSQAQLAERADLSSDTIKNIESGRYSMNLDTYLRIVEALGTTFSALLETEVGQQQEILERFAFLAVGRTEDEVRFMLHIVEQTLKAEDRYMRGGCF